MDVGQVKAARMAHRGQNFAQSPAKQSRLNWRSIICPTCAAPVGEECRTVGQGGDSTYKRGEADRPTASLHVSRKRIVRRNAEEGEG